MDDPRPPVDPPFCICIPARNEAERLPRLLEALSHHDRAEAARVVIALNNTTDRSWEILKDAQDALSSRLQIIPDACEFAPKDAHAGSARRRAFDVALGALEGETDAVIITTDADAYPPPDWISANLRAIAAGADIVGGRLLFDDGEPLPASVLTLRALWDAYWAQVREVEDAVDPIPWDPSPRHGDHTGGSLAITVKAYLAAGGVPLIASGEDRTLVLTAIANGARLRHPPEVWTRVSARRDGRAEGGMAAAMVDLFRSADCGEEVMVPGLDHWRARAQWRRDRRGGPDAARRIIEEEARLPPMPCDARLSEIASVSRQAEAVA